MSVSLATPAASIPIAFRLLRLNFQVQHPHSK
ncbi:hypothetical protein K4A87_01995 [Xanthomonas fragariae]|nr:hypothetical protein K4A87_01995 [Xanthomonas fragariae]